MRCVQAKGSSSRQQLHLGGACYSLKCFCPSHTCRVFAACGFWMYNTDFDSIVIDGRDAKDRHDCKVMCEEDQVCNAAAFINIAPAVSGACHFKLIDEHTVSNPDVAADSIRLCQGMCICALSGCCNNMHRMLGAPIHRVCNIANSISIGR